MLVFLFLFLSFFQVGLMGLGGNAGAQALLEHEAITLHGWLSPAQMADLMALGRLLPGGTALNTAAICSTHATLAYASWWMTACAGLASLLGLSAPALLWTGFSERILHNPRVKHLKPYVMNLLRPLMPGLIIGAALMMVRTETFGVSTLTPWELGVNIFLFLSTIIGVMVYRFNAGFMVILCGIAGWILL